MKPLGGYAGYTLEWRELAQSISKDIYLHNPDVRWDDIIGLDAAKRLVKEAVVYPIKVVTIIMILLLICVCFSPALCIFTSVFLLLNILNP